MKKKAMQKQLRQTQDRFTAAGHVIESLRLALSAWRQWASERGVDATAQDSSIRQNLDAITARGPIQGTNWFLSAHAESLLIGDTYALDLYYRNEPEFKRCGWSACLRSRREGELAKSGLGEWARLAEVAGDGIAGIDLDVVRAAAIAWARGHIAKISTGLGAT